MTVRNRKPHHATKAEKVFSIGKTKKSSSKCFQITLVVGAFLLSFLSAMGWHYYVESRVTTPFPAKSAVQFPKDEHHNEMERLWGSYR